MRCFMLAVVYANLDSATWNNRVIRCKAYIVLYSVVAPEIKLMLLILSHIHHIWRIENNVLQIELVHSEVDLTAGDYH